MRTLFVESLPGCGRSVEDRLHEAEAVEATREEIVAQLRAEARRLVARHGGDDDLVDVAIEHKVGPTRIVITLPPGAEGVEQLVATHVHARYQPPAPRCDRTVDVGIARSAVDPR